MYESKEEYTIICQPHYIYYIQHQNVTIIPEESEDMWHAYNLVAEGDSLRASTIRKVTTESSTGSVGSNRVRTTLTVRVENVDFDTQACVLRVKGRNIQENQYVKMGAYHTIDLELNRKFTLVKAHWDSVALDRLDMACDPTQHADLAAIIMQEGLANVCLVTASMTLVKAKIDVNIPRKRKGQCSQHEKGLNKFFESVMQALLRHVNFEKILQDPVVQNKLSDTKAAGEVKVLECFYTILQTEPDRAFYGIKHVEKACKAQAIETLLISDNLFRCQDVAQRKCYVNLVDSVKESGGDVKLFSSLHISGEQLEQLTGVAAILRFPMPELEEEGISSGEED
ncbi:pelota mRNA surveillance and ribosome rescue factor isoform X4 [Tachypleus tridentatus]|uniref:pelota mRNA surveillance and ribosome rescue factor isoform X4 n=1 Tax=Tachypleus tridentatus TaxID=6853 RepID=UPI003FD6A81D